MRKMLDSLLKVGAVCEMLMAINPFTSLVAIGPGFTADTYVATTTAENINISKSQGSEEVLMTAKTGNVHKVLEDVENGWTKVQVNSSEGFLPASGDVTMEQVEESEMAEVQQDAAESSDTYKRQRVMNYAMQFVDGRHKYGGSGPRTGTGCSGFTRYVLQNSADVPMNRSSGGQIQQGIAVSADQMQPGDLIFYGNGRSINHVAICTGNEQIVYTSAERTGITMSNWNYRSPVRIVDVLGWGFQYK